MITCRIDARKHGLTRGAISRRQRSLRRALQRLISGAGACYYPAVAPFSPLARISVGGKHMATQSQASVAKHESLIVRRATPADAEVCGRICFEAFGSIAGRHNFPQDFPAPEVSVRVLSTMFSNPGFFCVVAELNGRVIGSNCLDERTPIAGVGPITIDPAEQSRTAGRQLMQAVIARATERKFAGIRLVQAAYHNRSLSLYTKLGFVVREPLTCMKGSINKTLPGYQVRLAQPNDIPACNDLCTRVHGHGRGGELKDA